MGFQAPLLSNRTTPMLIPGILTVIYLYSYPSDDASEGHYALSLVQHLSLAEGEKLRPAGRLLLEAFAPSVGASTRALLPMFLTLSRAKSALYYYPRSLVLSYG